MRLGRTKLLLALVPLCLSACSGSSVEKAPEATVYPEALLSKTWLIHMTSDEGKDRYFADGWVKHTVKRRYCEAVKTVGASGGLVAARMHTDIAALYKQGTLVATRSLMQTYDKTPQASDPAGGAHLVAIAYAIEGDIASARKASKQYDPQFGPDEVWHTPWKNYLNEESPSGLSVDLSGLPVSLGEPSPGSCPNLQGLPHYSLKERDGSTFSVDMADPGALFAVAKWHEQAALLAAGEEHRELVATYGARYNVPGEVVPSTGVPLHLDFLVGSDFAVPSDAQFLNAALGEKGLAAVPEFKNDSLLAFVTDLSMVDGTIQPDKAFDVLVSLRKEMLRLMEKTSGTVENHYRPYTDILTNGILRNLALIAQRAGEERTSGILSITAMDQGESAATTPEGLLSLAAWDAGNRYPGRALEIIHSYIKSYPSLEAVKFGLDVFAIRVSRERTGTPGL